MDKSLLAQLVNAKGIGTEFIDAYGQPTTIAEESQASILSVMGYPVEDENLTLDRLGDEIAEYWATPLDPVLVLRIGETLQFNLRVSLAEANKPLLGKVIDEAGQAFQFDIVPVEHLLVESIELDEQEYHQYLVTLPQQNLPIGYYQIQVCLPKQAEIIDEMQLILAPKACYTPEHIAQGNKIWGLSVQLYCLRSENNWGIGDFSDLQLLLRDAQQQGADFIGLNPIHALYPNNPDSCSPYSPSSRKWLNYLYIDVTQVPGYHSDGVQTLIAQAEFQAQIAHNRDSDWVDYEGVAAVKLPALKACYHAVAAELKDNALFQKFVQQGGESLRQLAIYDALQEHLKTQGQDFWGWPVFPESLRQADLPAVSEFAQAHDELVTFYLFIQWQAQVQFEAASDLSKSLGMTIGLYRDLAVGVSQGSAEIWGNQALYHANVSVGAPPDILGPLGQKWGLPPMDPNELYQQQYQPMIELFRSNMANSGALRIDHAMGLLRLWWVVGNDSADKGGYVFYPVDDLLGILALESHRNQTLIIGEDLGTVPEEIRAKLADNGVYSYRVFFFEQAEDGGFFSPSHYPVQSMSTITIHDFPTLIGYWHCYDLELGRELGLYPDDQVLANLYEQRHAIKQQILNSLHGHQSIPEHIGHDINYIGMSRELNYGMQVHMAHGSSALMCLQLEDWLEMDKPVNIPGTFNEYPNWKRKLSTNLEDIFTQTHIVQLAQNITQARQNAGKR